MLFLNRQNKFELGLLPITTLVIWQGCMMVGLLGLKLRYPWPQTPVKEPPPVVAEIMHVELTKNTAMPTPDVGQPSAPAAQTALPQPPAAPPAIVAPPQPALVAVAKPSPAIAFPLPVEGPSHEVEAKQAIPAPPPPEKVKPAAPSPQPTGPQRLVYGQGEARQPAPEYPRKAVLAHQQGTVVVRFTVGQDGRVQTAQAASPSPFPLLNQAAVRSVRETWRFRPGPPRTYEVAIEFQLRQR